jgi:hypothetical protein
MAKYCYKNGAEIDSDYIYLGSLDNATTNRNNAIGCHADQGAKVSSIDITNAGIFANVTLPM